MIKACMVLSGYRETQLYMRIFPTVGYILIMLIEPWLQGVTDMFSILGYILKLGYSGDNRLQGVTGIFSVMGYIIKLGYRDYNWLHGLQVYFLLWSIS